MGITSGFFTFDEFRDYCVENPKFGFFVLEKTRRYTPFVFGDMENLTSDTKIQLCAGYYVIKELLKVLKPRTTGKYKLWRKYILSRDDYKCTNCESCENLEVHHIEPVAEYPSKAIDINNGITLCKKCHKKEHYGS